MTPAISIRDLSKCYRIRRSSQGKYGTDLADDFMQLGSALLKGRIPRVEYDDFWALSSLDLDIMPGEIVALMGHNGAGKSTLLKILARVVRPTTGEAVLEGRVGSLLEVGTGFHPDLTGRENVYLAGAIMGLSRRETSTRFDEIVAFSEVEAFLDTPVKRYSSGMYTRLAFAVAAHLDSDILLVDEVLAVGDAEFQRKCLGRMSAVARQGRTVVYVSHNLPSIRSFCSRGVLFRKGHVLHDGPVSEVIATYVNAGASGLAEVSWAAGDPGAPEGGGVRLRSAWVADADGNRTTDIDARRPFTIGGEIELAQRLEGMRIGFRITDTEGQLLCFSHGYPGGGPSNHTDPGPIRFEATMPGHVFNAGQFNVSLWFDAQPYRTSHLVTEPLFVLAVSDPLGHGPAHEKIPGVLLPDIRWVSSAP